VLQALLLAVAVAVGPSLAAPSLGAQTPEDRATYVERLDLPVASDGIQMPRAVVADLHTGEVFVSDAFRNRIVIFGPEGDYRYQITGGRLFTTPRDVAVDPEGYILVVATNRERRVAILELDFDGLFLRELPLTNLPEGAAEPFPVSVALSPAGDRLYVLDLENRAVWIADRDGAVQGRIDPTEGMDEKERRELVLTKVDVYGDRVLVAMPKRGQIWTYDLDGGPRRRIGLYGTAVCQLAFPVAAAVTGEGEVLVVDQQRTLIVRWEPVGNRCLAEYYGIGGAPGFLYHPLDVALGPEGRLYVTQGFEGRVQVYEGLPGAAAPPPTGPGR
jgi:DNA-binding beta-propeller fold protein YncE